MNPPMVPTIVPETPGERPVDVPLGLKYDIPSAALAGHRLAVEMALPVAQDLSGPQLETDWILTARWHSTF